MSRRFHVTREDEETFSFVGGRYGWADEFPEPEAGSHTFAEHELWEWKEAVDADMEGGHSPFPMLDPDSRLYEKLWALYESIE